MSQYIAVIQRRRLIKALDEFERAVVFLTTVGANAPEDRAEIHTEYMVAKSNLANILGELFAMDLSDWWTKGRAKVEVVRK